MVETVTANYGWTKPEITKSASTWGGFLNGDLDSIDAQVYANEQAIAALNAGNFSGNQIVLNKATVAAGNPILGQFSGTLRWAIELGDGTAEGSLGSNVGSDFAIYRYDDLGNFLDGPLTINRATGAAVFGHALTVGGGLTCNGAAGVVGTLTCNGAAGFSGTLSCAGTASFSGALSCAGTASFSGATVTVDQGRVTIARGAQVNPAIFLSDNTSNRSVFFFDTVAVRTRVQDQVSGGSLEIDAAANFLFEGSGQAFKAGGGSWSVLSDARTKTVIGDYTAGLDEVMQLRPVLYVYKGNDAPPGQPSPTQHTEGKQFVGFVAQDLETVMPDMVSRQDGYIDGQKVADMRAVDVSSLVFALVNSVKALKAEIEALKAK